MANTIIELRYSQQTGNTPSSLANGEIAINTYDGKLFYRGGPSNTIQTIERYTGPAGLNGEIQFNDSGVLGANSRLTFNKATGLLSATLLRSTQSSGDEGGQLDLSTAATNQSLVGGSVAIDVFQNRLRIFETGGTNRGVYIDMANGASAGVGTDLLAPSTSTDGWARNQANSAFQAANSAGSYANSAFAAANSAGGGGAAAASSYANSAFAVANSASTYANGAFGAANTADAKAVTSGSYANSAFGVANNATTNSASASSYANSSFAVANSGSSYANSAFAKANNEGGVNNTQNNNISAASSYANSAFGVANTASDRSLSAGIYANGAFTRANNSLNANTGGTVTGNTTFSSNVFLTGNGTTLSVTSNLSFISPNTQNTITMRMLNGGTLSFSSNSGELFSITDSLAQGSIFSVNDISGLPVIDVDANGWISLARYGGNVHVYNTAASTSNTTGALVVDGGLGVGGNVYANAVYDGGIEILIHANAAFSIANSAAIAANTPSHVANSAASYANSAFASANNGNGVDLTQNNNISAASSYANSAFGVANTASDRSLSAGIYANGAFAAANSANATDATQNNNISAAASYANSAFAVANSGSSYANSAFTRANNSINANTGGTITGDLTVTQNLSVGNLFVSGQTFSVNAGTIVANDTLLILGSGNYLSDTKDIGFAGHYNDGTNAHSGLIRDIGTKEWYLFKNYTLEIGANNNVDITDPSFVIDTLNANLDSTLITVKNIDLLTYVNNAFNAANTADAKAVTSGSYANSAFLAANNAAGTDLTQNNNISAAASYANSGFAVANSGSSYANSAFGVANTASDRSLSAGIYANGAFTAANNAAGTDLTQNNNISAASSYANSAFLKANNEGGVNNTQNNNISAASSYANSGFAVANSAASYANAAFAKANTGGTGSATVTIATFNTTANGTTSTYDLGFNPAAANAIFVTIDGVVQPESTYSVNTLANTITFGTNPGNTENVRVVAFAQTNPYIINDGSIDPVKFSTASNNYISATAFEAAVAMAIALG